MVRGSRIQTSVHRPLDDRLVMDGSVERIVSAPDTRADPLLIGCLAAVVAARWPGAARGLSGRAGVAAGWPRQPSRSSWLPSP